MSTTNTVVTITNFIKAIRVEWRESLTNVRRWT